MPSEHRHVRCTKCDKQLRLTVSEKNFGKEVEVTCSKCGNKFRTTISYPAKTHEEILRQVGERIMDRMNANEIRRLSPLMKEFSTALDKALATSSDLENVVEKIRQAGYDPFVVLEASIGFKKREGVDLPQPEIREPTSLVQDGEVVPGTFNEDGDKWMGKLKISFGDN